MKKKMSKKNKKRIRLGIIIIVSVVAILFVARMALTKGSIENPTIDAFAQCLTDSGLIMYGTEWCGYCKKQKELFGDSFEFVNYIDCDKNGNTCTSEGIKGFPTWKINGENYPGVQSFENLGILSGCELK